MVLEEVKEVAMVYYICIYVRYKEKKCKLKEVKTGKLSSQMGMKRNHFPRFQNKTSAIFHYISRLGNGAAAEDNFG